MAEDRTPSIEVENLSKSYGDFMALGGISFKVQPGEIVGFLGPNGAGKTTTMKILTCFMAASGGSAKVVGHDVYSESEAVRRKIGYLPESVPLYDDMIVYDYLNFMAEIRGVEKSKRHAAIKRAAELTGLTQMIGREIFELSKGFRQRVGLAQAIIHEPDVVILDEPTSGLDPNQILEIRDLIKEIGREKTVIFSTHILSEVAAVCDRIIVINRGVIVADGTYESLSKQVASKSRAVLVSFSEVPEGLEAALRAITDVSEVEHLGNNRYRLATENETSVRRQILKQSAANEWDLVSLEIYTPNLEETFRALTSVQAAASRAAKIDAPELDAEIEEQEANHG